MKEDEAEACLALLFHVPCDCGGEVNAACCRTRGSAVCVCGVCHDGQGGRAQSQLSCQVPAAARLTAKMPLPRFKAVVGRKQLDVLACYSLLY